MGLMNKLKQILFDEDEVEVPVGEDVLPEREPKKEKEKEEKKKSVIQYHDGDVTDETSELDTIKEIKVPDVEEEDEEEEPKKSFKFDIDLDDELPTRTRSNEELDELPTHEAIEKDAIRERDRRLEEIFAERQKPTPEEVVKTPAEEAKDYKKLLEPKENNSSFKKPFRVTPIISPVFGYMDPEYIEENEKREVVKTETVVKTTLKRDFGPVSYNDDPIIYNQTPVKKTTIKKDIVELSSTISNEETEEVTPVQVVNTKTEIEETEIMLPDKKEDVEIPEIETSGVEEAYLNNGIEDAFETTSEFDKIKEDDKEVVNYEDDPEELDNDDYIPGYEDESVFEDTKEIEPSYLSEYDEHFESTAPINLDELDNVTKQMKKVKEDKNENASTIEEEIEEEDEDVVEEPKEEKKTTKKAKQDDDNDENLDEEIETDLFNLIDSMYKSDEDEEEEDE